MIRVMMRVKDKALRQLKHSTRLRKAKEMGITFVPPNYVFLDRFNSSSVIIDVGCGYDADFSLFMISKFGLRAIALDPTEKHAQSLRSLEAQFGGRFKHVPLAVAATDGTLRFHESLENVSGSILADHTNVINDPIRTYEVESTSMQRLLERLHLTRADYLKLDLEGAEYEVINSAGREVLSGFDQIFVEFHHHCSHYSIRDTHGAVALMAAKGFQSFTLDDHNYLFFRSGNAERGRGREAASEPRAAADA